MSETIESTVEITFDSTLEEEEYQSLLKRMGSKEKVLAAHAKVTQRELAELLDVPRDDVDVECSFG